MQGLFVAIYDWLSKRAAVRRLLFWGSFAVWIALACFINFKQDVADMLPESKDLRAMNEVLSHTKAGEQLIFLLTQKSGDADPDSLIMAAESFAQQVRQAHSKDIDSITLQVQDGVEESLTGIMRDNLPLFLTEKDYAQLDSLTQPEAIRHNLEANRNLLLSPASAVMKGFVATDPIGISGTVWKKLSAIRADTSYELYEGYLFRQDQKQLTFFVKLKDKTGAGLFTALDKTIATWQSAHTGMQLIYFGGAAVAAGNASQLQKDTIITLSVTIVLLMAVTYYYFRRKRTPLLLLLPVVYGAAFGLAIVYLVQGSIAIMALGAGAIILGIAIDFSVHFLSHAREASVRDTVKDLAQPLTIGSFTTIAAFLSLQITGTPVLQDLGLFAAASLAGAAICTLVFLPHMPLGKAEHQQKETLFDKLGKWQPERNKWLVAGIILLTPVMGWFAKGVSYDSDLMHLNYMSPKLQAAQDRVSRANAMALSSVYLIAEGGSEDEALQRLLAASPAVDRLVASEDIRSISNPASLLPSTKEQEARIKSWKDYWTEDNRLQVASSINDAAEATGYNAVAFQPFYESLSKDYEALGEDETSLLKSLFPAGFAQQKGRYYAVASMRVPAESRAAVYAAFKDQPGIIVTDRQQGANQLANVMKQDFSNIAIWSSCIVFFALLLAYGRIELAVIAFLPMAISWVWILGLMAMLGLQFNIVNIIISSLIFGLGDDYTIFTMDGLVEKYQKGNNKLASTRAAVYVSVLTVIIGLGVLLLAKHPALRSIAFISITGLLCVLLISQTLQPFLFNWLIQRRADKGFLPFTAWSLLKSLFAFSYFFLGSLILSVVGIVLTKLWPFGRERGKYLFHRTLSRYTHSMMYVMMNVKKRVLNPYKNDFSKPAVYIANHASFLDILIITMLHPRLVLLTNKWVWRSPVFGAVVRMAEYYPVADGVEESLAPLEDLVRRGYSIAVFPEGTRSYTDRIQRFHKGAFYIAEKLGLDIVPVLLHGVHYAIQKGDWLLKNGTCTIKILERIQPDDASYGATYSARAKALGSYMRLQLAEEKTERETPTYFREQLLRCYTYKGPTLEWYCRVKTAMENNYEAFHTALPREGLIYDLGCGYGFAAYMLQWSAPERRFIGLDYDDEKIETAQGVHLRSDAVQFAQADLTEVALQPCMGILLMDVLHYLLPAQQEALLQKCADALLPGGILIVRDGIQELSGKIEATKQTEVWSTRILKFNKTQNELHFLSEEMIDSFSKRNGLPYESKDMEKRTANRTYFFKKVAN